MMENPMPLTVTQLNRRIRSWLETEIEEVTVVGELSNLSRPSSGHLYFCLKDASAQLRCVHFRNHHEIYTTSFKDGQQVIAQGKLSLYEARGDYQLIVYSLTDAGFGDLYLQFEQLKTKLQTQGLFDSNKKKPIPPFPTVIGVITSPHGAALHDILSTLARRFPLATVKIYPSEVQGQSAAKQLVKAILKANTEKTADVLILARGGGSIEDLWAFNDEHLALAIYQSTIPIVSGIGHETDFTIADFVADLRAATPTAAAEAVTPNRLELLNLIKYFEKRMVIALTRFLQHKQLVLSHQANKLLSPDTLIAKHWQTLDYLERQLQQNMHHLIYQKQHQLHLVTSKLHAKNPIILLKQSKVKLHYFKQQLTNNIWLKLNTLKQIFTTQLTTLHTVSPLATLNRGYAIATHQKTILLSSTQVRQGDIIHLRLAEGNLLCEIIDNLN